MVEAISSLLGGKKKGRKESLQEEPTRNLSGQEFVARLERDIEGSGWAPQLSSQLTEITLAELECRSPIDENMRLYAQLATRASYLAAKEGTKWM